MQAAIEAGKAAVMLIREVDNWFNGTNPIYTMPRSGAQF